VAKGFACALNIPIVGVPTLDVVAQPFADQRLPVCAVVHAGRGRFCIATYGRKRGRWVRTSEFRLVAPAGLVGLISPPMLFCGELDDEMRTVIQQTWGERALIASPARAVRRAAVLAEMAWQRMVAGQSDDLAPLSPIYLHQVQGRAPL